LDVLLVDDEKDFLEVAKELLERERNFKVAVASSVDEALKKLSKSAFDVVVSDYKLGEKSGLDLLQLLKKESPQLPVIFFTGKGSEEVAVKALNCGVDGYVSKHGSTEIVYGELSSLIRLVAEKKKTQLTLEKSRKCYHAIIDQAVDSIFVLDLSNKILDVNQQACRSLQYTQRELLSLNITDLFAEPTKEELRVCLSELSKSNPVVFEGTQKRKDQSTFPVELSLNKIGLNGEAIIVLTAKDLTERKKAEAKLSRYAQLQAATAELEQLALTQPDLNVFLNEVIKRSSSVLRLDSCAYFEFSPNKRVLSLRACKGLNEDLVNALTYRVDDFSQLWTTLLREGMLVIENWASEKHFELPQDVATVSVRSSICAVVGCAEKPFGLLGGHVHEPNERSFESDERGFFRSIATLIAQVIDHKNMLDKLHESETTYRDLFNGMNESAWVISFDGKFIDLNDTAVNVLGYSKEELLSMGPVDIDSNLSREQIDELIKRLPSDRQQIFETEHTAKDGKKIPVEISSTLINYKGQTAILSIARDISERKVLQARLRNLSYQLNGLAAGESYLCEAHTQAFKAYADLTFYGVPGLCIVREDPHRIIKDYGVKSEDTRLLSSKSVKGFVALSDLQSVSLTISDFLKLHGNGIVLLDGLEYLISLFGFDAVFRLIQEKRFDFLENGGVLLVPVDVAALTAKEKALLLSELKPLAPATTSKP